MLKSLPVFLTTVFTALGAMAQPVITLQDVTPEYGTSYTVQSGIYVDPGDSGANQTWDLSGMFAQNPSTSTYQSPDGLPGSVLFPSATHVSTSAMIGSSHTYFSFENNQINELGFVSSTPNVTVETVFTESRMRVQFPLEYGDSFTDTYASETDNAIIFNEDTTEASILESGSYAAEVDGYGTLTTGSGTYENVLRITYQIESEFTVTTDGVETGSGERVITETAFYNAGYPIPLATVRTTTIYSMGEMVDEASSGNYVSDISVGLDEAESLITDLQIFPNPAHSSLTASLSIESSQQLQFSLNSTEGKEIHVWPSRSLSSGKHHVEFALPEIANGIYLLEIQTNFGIETRRIIINR